MSTLYDQKGQPVSIPDENVPDAIASGKYGYPRGVKVQVEDSDGQRYEVDPVHLPELTAAGHTFIPPEQVRQEELQKKYGGVAGQAEAAGEGALRGLMPVGSSDILQAAGVSGQRQRDVAEANPITANVAEYGTLLGSTVATGGESGGAKLAAEEAAAKSLPRAAEAVEKAAPKIEATTAKTSATALENYGRELGESAGRKQRAEQVTAAGKRGARGPAADPVTQLSTDVGLDKTAASPTRPGYGTGSIPVRENDILTHSGGTGSIPVRESDILTSKGPIPLTSGMEFDPQEFQIPRTSVTKKGPIPLTSGMEFDPQEFQIPRTSVTKKGPIPLLEKDVLNPVEESQILTALGGNPREYSVADSDILSSLERSKVLPVSDSQILASQDLGFGTADTVISPRGEPASATESTPVVGPPPAPAATEATANIRAPARTAGATEATANIRHPPATEATASDRGAPLEGLASDLPPAAAPNGPGALKHALELASAPNRAIASVGNAAADALGLQNPLARAVARGAVEAPIYQIGANLTDDVFQDREHTASSVFGNLPAAAIFGGVGGASVEHLLGVTGKYAPEAMDKAASWFDRAAEKASAKGIDTPEDVRAVAAKLARGDDNFQAFVKDLHEEAKPQMVRALLESEPADMGAPQAVQKALGQLEKSDFQNAWGSRGKVVLERALDRVSSAEDKAGQFLALDQAKRDLDKFRPKKPLEGADQLVYDRVMKARDLLKTTLENEQIYGRAATYQKDLNQALAPFYDARKELRRRFFEKMGDDRVASPGRVATYLDQAAKNDPRGDLRGQALHNYLQSAADAMERIKANTYEVLGKKPVSVDALNANLDEIQGATEKALESKRAELAQTHGHGIAGMALHHAPFSVRALAGLVSVARGAKAEAVAAIAKKAAESSRKMGESLDAFFNGKSAPRLTPKPGSLRDVTILNPGAKGESEAEAFNRVVTDLRTIASDQGRSKEAIRGQMPNLSRHTPQIADTIANLGAKAASYLASVAPSPDLPPTGFPTSPLPPSDSQMAAFNKQVRAVMAPESIVDDMHDRTLTADQVKAVATVHPQWYADYERRVLQATATTGGHPLTYQDRLMLSTALRRPAHTSLFNVPGMQQMFKVPGPSSMGNHGGGRQMTRSKMEVPKVQTGLSNVFVGKK
jgi:hypothetical protein